ncbi:M23 family metallopeptidase [Lysobacter sp. CA199]|uniref:M23 family metallopeptidase n=1 Tax=Lysobacter sp. CA199 TaxID=3455608 RepID=UPI003F8D4CD5
MPRPLALVSTVILLCGLAADAGAAALFDSFDLSVPQPPAPVSVEGRPRLIYELHLSHFGERELTPTALRIVDADRGTALASFTGSELAARSRIIGRKSGETGALRPGEREVIYLEVEPGGVVPKRLRHALEFTAAGSDKTRSDKTGSDKTGSVETVVVEGASIAIGTAPALQLGPPLRGGPWIAIYAPQWPRGHRRVFYTLDGRARLPGRYAIDWVRLDGDGRTGRGGKDQDLVSDSLGYGEPVLAVADATVAVARDGVDEAARVSLNPKHAFGQAPGNYVVLALADGRFATYEHLRTGSVKVREGDKVRVGQTIAELGFTGDSTGPHLHFHLADGRVPLAAEGLPYGFAGFRLLGHYSQFEGLGKQRWDALPAGVEPQRRDELPASNAVIEFPR